MQRNLPSLTNLKPRRARVRPVDTTSPHPIAQLPVTLCSTARSMPRRTQDDPVGPGGQAGTKHWWRC